MNIVDFTEIATSIDWELFAQAFFRSKGFQIVEGPSIGSDSGTGKDLIIEEVKNSEFGEIRRRFLVSCKHYAHRERSESVKEGDEKDSISVNLDLEDCDGFIGFYSTFPTSTLLDNLRKLRDKKNQLVEIFDYERIEEYLLFGEKENELLKRFFSKSYKKWRSLSKKEIEQNPNFRKLIEEDFKIRDKEYFKKYYEGQPADWSIIRKYTFKRESFNYVIKQLDANKVCLVTGAGGEGKTTLLMQVADHYLKDGYHVYFSFETIQNINVAELKFKPKEKYLLILDNASSIENLHEFIWKIKLSPDVNVLLGSRKNEWLYSLSMRTDNSDLLRFIGREITLSKLSNNEVNELSYLLDKHNVLHPDVKEKLQAFLIENTDFNFLLSVMTYATQGKSFDLIISDVINKLQNWEDSELTVQTIGYIVCIEVLGRGNHGVIYCHEGMLRKLMNIKNNNQYKIIKQHLAQEAFFQGSLNNLIYTRNPIIAKLYFDCIFNSDVPLLDKYEFYYNIIRVASLSNHPFNLDILALIPKYFYFKDKELAIQLLKDAISYGQFLNTYYAFIDDEILSGNIGLYSSEEYSARWLFEQAYSKNSTNPSLYVRWAKFEESIGNIGNVDTKYSSRWILRKGTEIAPDENQFVVWANIEIKYCNVGLDVETPYSARWILNDGLEKTPSSQICVVWAKLENENRNLGNIVDPYTARWILKQGFQNNCSPDLVVVWAQIEKNYNNIGKIEIPYTSRWILKKGLDNKYDSSLIYQWLELEISQGNIGSSSEYYSAQWLFEYYMNKEGLSSLTVKGTEVKNALELKDILDKVRYDDSDSDNISSQHQNE